MPKKPPRNAFYFYAQDYKEEQRKVGIHYKNLAELMTAAGLSWPKLHPSERAKYETRAKDEKEKYNVPEKKFTSQGVSLAEIERQQREERDMEEAEKQDIRNFVKLKSFNNSIITEDIYLMDVNVYCQVGTEYLIGESTLLRFNLKDGIKDSFHEIINPGTIPAGYTRDVTLGCEEFGLEMPDEEKPVSNYIQVLATTVDYLKQKSHKAKDLPPVYTMPEKVAPVRNFIQQMCNRAAEDETLFRVYQLNSLLFQLVNAVRRSKNEGLPRESLALEQLRLDRFKYNPRLGCEMHEEGEKPTECSLARVKRWAFTVMDSCCELAGVAMKPVTHLPPEFDLQGIVAYKESLPRGAGRGSLSLSLSLNDSADASHASHASQVSHASQGSQASHASTRKEQKFSDTNMRMPSTNWSKAINAPPQLTESEFPSLVSSAGRGRGGGKYNKK